MTKKCSFGCECGGICCIVLILLLDCRSRRQGTAQWRRGGGLALFLLEIKVMTGPWLLHGHYRQHLTIVMSNGSSVVIGKADSEFGLVVPI